MSGRPGRGDAAACLLLGALVAACYAPELLGRKSLYFFDVSSLNIPARDWAFRQIRSGTFPEWCTCWYAGFPFIAESQAGLYYPPNYLFFLPFPSWYATTLAYTSHLWLAAVGSYFLFRRWSSAGGAWLGAAAFALGGRLLDHQIHAAIAESIAWLPLILVALTRFVERGERRALWWAVLMAAVQTLAGSLHTVVISHLAAAVYLLALAGIRQSALQRTIVGVVVAAAAGAALAAALLVPAFELFQQSHRSAGGAAEWANFGLIAPIRWIAFLAPGAFGSPAYATAWLGDNEPVFETGLYHGGLTLLLAAVGAFATGARRRGAFVGLVMVLVGMSLAAGDAHVLGAGLRKLPIFSGVRIPARYLLLTGLGLCQLAAIGWAELAENQPGARKRLAWALAAASVSVAAALAWSYGKLLGPYPPNVNPAGLHELLRRFGRQIIEADAPRLGLTLLAACCLFAARSANARRLAGLLLLLDLWWTVQLQYPTADPSIHAEPKSVAAIRRLCAPDPPRIFVRWTAAMARGLDLQVPGWRVGMGDYRRIADCLYYERGPLFGVGVFPDIGQLPLQTLRLAQLRATVQDPLRLQRVLGISLCMAPTPVRVGEIVFRGAGCVIERASGSPPYALFTTAASRLPEPEVLARLQATTFDPATQVLLEGEPSTSAAAARTTAATADWDGPNRLLLDVDAPAAGVLLVHEMYDRGWTATVDGAPASIERANWLFMGVRVDAGTHHLELTYAPASVRWGRRISAIAILAWVAAGARRIGRGAELPLDVRPPSTAVLFIIFAALFVLSAVVLSSRWVGAFPTLLGQG